MKKKGLKRISISLLLQFLVYLTGAVLLSACLNHDVRLAQSLVGKYSLDTNVEKKLQNDMKISFFGDGTFNGCFSEAYVDGNTMAHVKNSFKLVGRWNVKKDSLYLSYDSIIGEPEDYRQYLERETKKASSAGMKIKFEQGKMILVDSQGYEQIYFRNDR
jgi:hypothetical protein